MMIKAAVAVKVIMMITDFESCFFFSCELICTISIRTNLYKSSVFSLWG